MTKQVMIVTGDAGESYETLYAKHRLEEAGYIGHVVAPVKKMLNLVIHDFEPGWDTYKESPGYKVTADYSFAEVNSDDYDAILLLGGRAPEYLRHNHLLLQLVQDFHTADKWIFSICHGIQILLAAGLAPGKKLTSYEHIRYEVESNGGIYCNTQEAVRDGKIVTGQTWQSHPEFYREVFNCLGTVK
ncbi:MAG: DJ-1/PfpI family protein [Saprospiraceae bacterium]|nr:DJ-1/PfpI family protein [Saprospiraceae bacterium]